MSGDVELSEEAREWLRQSELDDSFEQGLFIADPPVNFFERRVFHMEEQTHRIRDKGTVIDLEIHLSLLRKYRRQLEQFKSGTWHFGRDCPQVDWQGKEI